MPDQKNSLPKVPPFIIEGTSGKAVDEPDTQPAHIVQPPRRPIKRDKVLSQLGMYSSLALLIGVFSMGVALISGAWFAYSVLGTDSNNEGITSPQVAQPQNNILPNTTDSQVFVPDTGTNRSDILYKVIVVGLAYVIGWVFSTFGVRILGNLILPYAIQVYAWVVLGGILILQILIMSRLYQQEYYFSNYVKYLSLFGAGMIALVGLHLILERHTLRPFGVLILLTSLGHLYFIVYHYIFMSNVVYEMLWGDLIFFFVTFCISLLMLAHFGLLNEMRRLIDRMFDPKTNKFIPPS